jgi:putative ATPase
VFWQPGSLGWEGQMRERLQQRRAAQLAAVAESALDQPDLLSSSPEDPGLERWLRRQAVAEGERLDRLRQRFWQDATIGRLDRLLVLEARSLLWALDPLQAASEGEVVLAVPEVGVRERLEGQLQVLDQLRRPRLLEVPPQQPERLAAQLDPAQRFEWFAARQPFRGLDAAAREGWLEQLTQRAAPGARARLLFSHPTLGPAGSLGAWLERQGAAQRSTTAEAEALAQAIAAERPALEADAAAAPAVRQGLERRGWVVRQESWGEELDLPLGEGLLQRWFSPAADYRQRLEAVLEAPAREALAALFRHHRGALLPQPLHHTLLQAEWDPEAAVAAAPTKKPRRKPGPER